MAYEKRLDKVKYNALHPAIPKPEEPPPFLLPVIGDTIVGISALIPVIVNTNVGNKSDCCYLLTDNYICVIVSGLCVRVGTRGQCLLRLSGCVMFCFFCQ